MNATATDARSASGMLTRRVPFARRRRPLTGACAVACGPRLSDASEPPAERWSTPGAVREPVDRPTLRWTRRMDDDAPRRLAARTLGAHACVVRQRHVDDASLVGVHRVERVALAAALDAHRQAQRQLAHLLLAPGAVALHVEDHAPALARLVAEHQVEGGLERAERPAAPPDEPAEGL